MLLKANNLNRPWSLKTSWSRRCAPTRLLTLVPLFTLEPRWVPAIVVKKTRESKCPRFVWSQRPTLRRPMAYAEHFIGRVHSVAYGGYLYLVCAVCDVTIWRHTHVYNPTFSRNLLTQYAYSSTRTSLLISVSLHWI